MLYTTIGYAPPIPDWVHDEDNYYIGSHIDSRWNKSTFKIKKDSLEGQIYSTGGCIDKLLSNAINHNISYHSFDDKPAYEYLSGTKIWCKNGHVHRVGRPAKISLPIKKYEWVIDNMHHRLNGPAIVYEGKEYGNNWAYNGDLIHENKVKYALEPYGIDILNITNEDAIIVDMVLSEFVKTLY